MAPVTATAHRSGRPGMDRARLVVVLATRDVPASGAAWQGGPVDRDDVMRWVAGYERAWRDGDEEGVGGLRGVVLAAPAGARRHRPDLT